ncbi:unnamed protein product [Discula destructiva]
MRGLFGLAALAATVVARTSMMVPLYVYPGNASWTNPEWAAAVKAFKANSHLHFYVVINPNNGPLNTSDPSGANGGYCNVYNDSSYIPHGCNRDWTTHLAALNKLSNVQTIGYVYTRYGARDPAAIKADIAEWAAWDTAPTWTFGGDKADIAVAGLWFDEIGADPSNATLVADLVAYANTTFGDDDRHRRRGNDEYSVILNAGPVANATYEAQLFALADAVVTKETCYTSDPTAAGVTDDCPEPYAPFDYAALTPGNGLPHDRALLPQTVVIVHQFVGPPAATMETLQAQVAGVVALGVHSTYFTGGSWHQTTVAPATIGNVSELLSVATGANGAVRSSTVGSWAVWVPWVSVLLHFQQMLGGFRLY